MFCYALLYVYSGFAIILMVKGELVALNCLSSRCPVIVMWLFLAVPWACLQFVIVVLPDHSHYLFTYDNTRNKARYRIKKEPFEISVFVITIIGRY